jgi:hypothetical protein
MDPVDGVALAMWSIGKIGFGIEAIEFCGFDQRVYDRARSPPLSEPRNRNFVRVAVMIRSSRSEMLLSMLRAAGGIAGQRIPRRQSILKRLSGSALAITGDAALDVLAAI